MVKSRSLNPVADLLGFNAVETGAAYDISDRTPGSAWSVTVAGTFVGTILVEVSNDGTNWAPAAAGLTAPGFVTLSNAVLMVRARCSAYTSGAAFATLAYDVGTR